MNNPLLKNLIFTYVIILLILLAAVHFGAFENIKNNLADKIYTKTAPLNSIVIVEIDDSSIQKIGRWPWNRSVYVPLLDKLKNARAAGIDVSFFENSSDDYSLRNKLAGMKNVVLASEVHEDKIYLPIFNAENGYVNLEADSDGIIRKVYLSKYDNSINNFAFEIYKKAWDSNAEIKNGLKRINFPGFSENKISFAEALEKNVSFDGKIVLIGAGAANLHDLYFVPVSSGVAMPGVEIHASIVQNLILDDFIAESGKMTISLLIFISLVVGVFVLSRLRIVYNISLMIGTILVYMLMSIFCFNHFSYLADLFYFPLSIVIGSFSGVGVRYLFERKHNQFITGAFGKYISKDLLKEIINKKRPLKLGGQKQEITTFFSDIRGFTSLSERVSPAVLVKIMNSYLTEMTEIIMKNKGMVDKFIGDAIMALWNAPVKEKEHAVLACKSAQEQIVKLDQLNKKWSKLGLPTLKIGCGINTGEAVVGNMGSKERFAYTAIGDSVNLASRLEGLTKYYGTPIIVSESTYKQAKEVFRFRRLDKVRVKGKQKAIEIYELCIEYDKELTDGFEAALEMYYKKNFEIAGKIFKKLYAKSGDSASLIFAERCAEYMRAPPLQGWDGSYGMKTK